MSPGIARSTNGSSGVNQHENPSDGPIKIQHREFIYTMNANRIFTRRDFIRIGAVGAAAVGAAQAIFRNNTVAADAEASPAAAAITPESHPFLTPAKNFRDVSRGTPPPHLLRGAAQAEARLTPETWRLEITADPFVEEPHTKVPATVEWPLTLADRTAMDLPALMELGRKHEVTCLHIMQCLNMDTPLGQGLWTGVPLREVLRLCRRLNNVRRIYFCGYHNNDPMQIFKSSVSYTQAMETPPGDPPVFLAYRLNGEPISPERGGPVRMLVPWSHGYKSIKWLQHIFVTNDPRNSDTYANGNNDPDSYLKTAAYVDKGPEKIKASEPVFLTGQVVCGPSGLRRVEYWVRRIEDNPEPLADDEPELLRGPWVACELQAQPAWSSVLPPGVSAKNVVGFDKTTGRPLAWPLRYSRVSYAARIRGLKPGTYEIRARAVDLNDFAQPEPRPGQKTGKNALQVRRLEIV
jgi:DMSO/TMAO reductase YedYZ molybdopterin-dependent catalytic subunit